MPWTKEEKIFYLSITNKKKHCYDVSSSKDAFLQDVFQTIAIAFFPVINHVHINGFHLF